MAMSAPKKFNSLGIPKKRAPGLEKQGLVQLKRRSRRTKSFCGVWGGAPELGIDSIEPYQN
jgi:hypothetical protein